MSVELNIKGLGPVPGIKNSKLLCRGRLVTKPEYQKWMKRAIQAIESQLLSGTPTSDAATWTTQQRLSWIVSNMPWDDSWTWIPEITVRATKVPRGQEGATITIEKVTV